MLIQFKYSLMQKRNKKRKQTLLKVVLTWRSMPSTQEAMSSSMDSPQRDWYAFLAPKSSSDDLVHAS